MPPRENLELFNTQAINESTARLLDDTSVIESSSIRSKPFTREAPSKRDIETKHLQDVNLDHPTSPYKSIDRPSETKRGKMKLALRHFSYVQLPSVAVTLVLISLYAAQVRWNNPPVGALNALQFAAKAHEGLILMSLGDILLCRISYGLQHQDIGVPIGFISSAFYIGAPLRYLVSSELWAPIFLSGRKFASDRITFFMVILITILCLSASPLSAILMIPIPGWWMDKSYDAFTVFYIENMTYKSILDSASGPFVNESIGALASTTREISTTFLSTTFSGDLRPIYSYPGLNQQAAQLLNISFSNYAARFRRTSVGLLGGLVIATCPLSFTASNLGDFGTITLSESLATSPPLLITAERKSANDNKLRRWKQPLLVTTCSRGRLDGDVVSFWFKSSLIDKTLTLNVKSDSALAELNKKHHRTPGPLGYRYLNLRQTQGWPVSADILFGNRTDQQDSFRAEYHLCLIFARWIEADVWMEPSTSADIFVHLPFPTTEALEKMKDSFETSDFIHINNGWMEGIGTLPNASFYDAMQLYCGKTTIQLPLERILALHVIDAMATELKSPNIVYSEYGSLVITRYAYTYAFNIASSSSIPVALCILSLHFFMILTHLILIATSRYPWKGSSWESFGDMLILALRSKAPIEPGDDEKKHSKSRSWATPVVIKTNEDDGRQHIVMKDGPEYREVSRQDPNP